MVDYKYRARRLEAAGVAFPVECGVQRRSVDEWVVVAERLAGENGGVLPGYRWLDKNGYKALDTAIRNHLERFGHISRERLRKSVDEQVAVAEKLAKEHGGVLPECSWLDENGHGGLYCAIRNYPERFSHIRQKRLQKTVDEQVALAERLAKEHDGVLPGVGWFKKNGYKGLNTAIRSHPERFSHIRREKLLKTVDEWVVVAERLAKENGGVLPYGCWLKKNGHIGLERIVRIYPERFSRIRQERLTKTVDEQVAVAERLAKENGGVLLRTGLRKNGHGGLDAAMWNHPERFSHIRQEWLRKSVDEQVVVAERLAGEHGGTLPRVGWLQKNGYGGLSQVMRKHPGIFSRVKQAKRLTKTVDEQVAVAERLAKENGGVLPGGGWLKRHGHGGLCSMMWKHPGRFSHIRQERLRKSVDEQVAVAERLAKEHGGTLPGYSWFQRQGRCGLYQAMGKYPERFIHIKQTRLGGLRVVGRVARRG